MSWLTIATAGIWPIVGHYGFGGLAVAGCLAAAYFSPLFKKEFVWAAVVIAAGTICYAVGVHDGEARVQAKWDAAIQATIEQSDKARAGAVRDAARKPSRWLPNHRDRFRRD